MMKEKIVRDIMIWARVLQVVDNEDRVMKGLPRIGKGYFKAQRFNPYNPLSYIVFLTVLPIVVLCYGVVGSLDKVENPFLWN